LPNRFCILASARSGSNHFGSLLNRHPKLWMHGEIFHQNAIFETLRKHVSGAVQKIESPGYDLERRKKYPFEYLEALMKQTDARFVTGFKIFPAHDDRVAEAMIDDPQVRKIVLVRMNALAQYSSDLEASARNKYAFTKDEHPESVEINFDAKEFEQRRRWISGWYERAIKRLNKAGQTYFLMPYELMGNDTYIRSAFVSLGLTPPDMDELRSQFRKSGARNVVERFADSEKVRAYLRDTGQHNLEFDLGYNFL
jgi:hypothetical protein